MQLGNTSLSHFLHHKILPTLCLPPLSPQSLLVAICLILMLQGPSYWVSPVGSPHTSHGATHMYPLFSGSWHLLWCHTTLIFPSTKAPAFAICSCLMWLGYWTVLLVYLTCRSTCTSILGYLGWTYFLELGNVYIFTTVYLNRVSTDYISHLASFSVSLRDYSIPSISSWCFLNSNPVSHL